MPRDARRKSETGIYHVILRGINQQQLFEDAEDNVRFLEVLKKYKTASGFELYGYCLMGNHVHLLIKPIEEDLALVFKRIGVKYVGWYNLKYERTGHLFQDRYRSEPVEDDKYFLTVLRYIHLNPMKAGLCNKLDEYPWSSYAEYAGDHEMVDTAFVLDMIGPAEFERFHSTENTDECLENHARLRLTDGEVKKIMLEMCKCDNASNFMKFDSSARKEYIQILKAAGASIRQIGRLTGVGRGIAERA